ncbi:MFS transporter [Actinocrinis sp.]|uniref:MFS transporter n=1 Tax=Actinocrinis sp. TaxID=1920516 RepID=UPI002D76C0B1|nr:MFS transporter [Actinocrinis sp.]
MQTAGVGFFPLSLLARLPYAMSSLATLILVQTVTGSYAFAGLAAAAQGLCGSAGAPVVGALADRYGHRRIAAVSTLANIAALLFLIAASRAARTELLAAAALVGLTQPPVGVLVRVYWSRLAQVRALPSLLPSAMAYEAAADETSFVAGPTLVGLLAPIATSLGPIAPIAASIVLLCVAALPFAMLYTDRSPIERSSHTEPQARLPRRALVAMFFAMAAIGAVFGAVQTGVTAYAHSIGRPGAAGLIYAIFGAGSALAGAACAWLPRGFATRHRYPAFAAALVAGMLALYVGDRLHAVVPAVAMASITVAPYMITLYTLTERIAPPDRTASAMTILCAGGPLGTAGGQALAGYLAQGGGSSGAFLLAPIAAAAALLLALALTAADQGRGTWLATG